MSATLRGGKTQREEYWRDGFAVTAADIEELYALLLEEGKPQNLEKLAFKLVEKRCEEEEALLRREAELHPVFRPQESYQVGQELTFLRHNDAIGTVISVRPGRNPAYGEFSVIEVRFGGEKGTRSFAAGFGSGDPPVNYQFSDPTQEYLSPDELITRYGEHAKERVGEALATNEEFVSFGSQWFLRELLAEIHVGHLNISDAMIDEAGHPLSAEEMVDELELPSNIKRAAQVFSLNYGLSQSEPFVNVGKGNQSLWFVPRLGPWPAER